jgi:TatD DNase family protein
LTDQSFDKIVDTHAHLNEPRFAEDYLVVRERARHAGVHRIVVVGYDLPSSRAALEMASHFGDGASVGVHPHDAAGWDDSALDDLHHLAAAEPAVAVGEIGLDYHYDRPSREDQIRAFRSQIRLAKARGLPLIMHCREAYDDLCRILEEEDAGAAGGVAHCFWGTDSDARRLTEMGFYLGVGGGVTFPKSEDLRRTLLGVPIDRILLETDCPYLAPLPYRGKRNEPAYLTHVAARLAELYGLSMQQVAQATTANAFRCFRRLPPFD